MIGAPRGDGTTVAAAPAPERTALLLCGGSPVPCSTLERIVTDAGLTVVAKVRHWSEAVERVAETVVDVAIVDLALAGSVGVRLISVLRTASPTTQVIVLSPLEAVDLAALDAGAIEVVQPTDLRPLAAALRSLVPGDSCATG
jgi:DNA-binding response OmpR family regulator